MEVNLRLPSMLHGKKGFDRLVWAAKHVLNRSLNWLFLDLNLLDSGEGMLSCFKKKKNTDPAFKILLGLHLQDL